MGYREFAAPPAGVVECGWSAVHDPTPGPTDPGPTDPGPTEHAVLPDGAMDLVWTGTALLVAGPDTAPHPVRREPGVPATGLRFRPGAFPALLGVPAHALRDQRIALDELRPDLAARAVARLEDGAPAAAVLRAVLGTMQRALPGPPDRAVAVAAARLAAGASAADTADTLGWTTRTLHRRSLVAFGYGPAVLRRVLRFRRAVALLHAGASPAQTAARAGFADQPHLSREVRALAGRSPAELVRGQPGSGA